MLRVDAVKGKLSLSLKPSTVAGGGGGGQSPGGEDAAGGGASDGSDDGDLDEEMADRLEALRQRDSDDEVREYPPPGHIVDPRLHVSVSIEVRRWLTDWRPCSSETLTTR